MNFSFLKNLFEEPPTINKQLYEACVKALQYIKSINPSNEDKFDTLDQLNQAINEAQNYIK